VNLQPSSPAPPTPPPPRTGDPRAADAIWNWRDARGGQAGHAPDAAAHAQREGTIRAIVGAVIGVVIFLFWHRPLAWVVWSIAALTFGAAVLSPVGIYRWIQVGVNRLAEWVSSILTWLVLPIFFFVFCFPFGAVARRGRNDRLERWFDRGLPSYWKRRKDHDRNAAFYERQF
jgi:hypothetical protein